MVATFILLLWITSISGVDSAMQSHLGFNVPNVNLGLKSRPLPVPESVTHNWGAYTPYHSLGEYYVPSGCSVKQVHLLERHGSRYPTANAGRRLNGTVSKFKRADDFTDPKMAFLKDYRYSLGEDDLLPFGAREAFESGIIFYERYGHLLSPSEEGTPFIRASGSQRVIESCYNFSSGIISAASTSRHTSPFPPSRPGNCILDLAIGPSWSVNFTIPPPIIISESPGSNNTLDAGSCPAAYPGPDRPRRERQAWVAKYAPPITKRINRGVRWKDSGCNAVDGDEDGDSLLIDQDIENLMEMCIFETFALQSYADGSDWREKAKLSHFCALFKDDEWESYSHGIDIDKYYNTGYGNPMDLGRVQGVGYASELLARLTSQASSSMQSLPNIPASFPYPLTNQNTSLPFPLDRSVYIDFTHDNLMVAVFAAMGLFFREEGEAPGRDWTVSRMTPFAGRMVVEKLDCVDSSPGSPRGESGEFVRILANDAVQPLGSPSRDVQEDRRGLRPGRKGLSALEHFLESQTYVKGGGRGDWERCFAGVTG